MAAHRIMSVSSSVASPSVVACLGPDGSFSHLLTEKRFPGTPVKLMPTIGDVFEFLVLDPSAMGIVPIENSSGGFIVDTVDRLVDERCQLHIIEELTLDVKLALLGHPGKSIDVIYSHPMPFFHSDDWLRSHHPAARRVNQPSTAAAAAKAAEEANAAAIGPRQNAERHALSILHFPIAGDVPNVTQFFLLSHQANLSSTANNRTALVVELPDRPGSLCKFLTPLSDAGVNMKRLESRPIRGQPNKYKFYIEIEGSTAEPRVAEALAKANAEAAGIRTVGVYPSGARFES